MRKKSEKNTTPMPSLRESWTLNLRAWKIWWNGCRGKFLAVFFSSLFAALTPYVSIWLSARLIGELSGGRDPALLRMWALLILGTAAVLGLAGAALNHWKNAENEAAMFLPERVYADKFLDMDFADKDSQATYDLYSRIRQDQTYMGWGLHAAARSFERLALSLFQIAGGVALSVRLFTAQVPESSGLAILNQPLAAVAMLGLLLGAAALAPVFTMESNKYWGLYTPQANFYNQIVECYLFEYPDDHRRALDQRMYCQTENVANPYLQQGSFFGPGSWIARKGRGPMGLWAMAAAAVSVVLTGMVYLFVCLKAWGGAFGVGAVTQYIGAATNLFLGIAGLLRMLGDLRSNGSFLQRTFQFLDIPNRMYQGSLTTEKRADRRYEVEFRDVSFRYPGSETYALRHVNLRFDIGSRLAVVGRNGSGKTTFIKLLCRLYDPTEGEILLNGIDIRKYRYDEYMAIFAVVFQDFQLLALSLGQNVAASVRFDAARATDCLNKAGFAERLARMPRGLDTSLYKVLDKDGVEVSGGEAQKIAIARALYKDAPFIVLDEPTAALDPIAEAEIYEKFDDIAGDKTAVYISHRLSSCKFCDKIVVFDDGQIVQQGSHESLLHETGGTYAALWNAQAQYYTHEAHEE